MTVIGEVDTAGARAGGVAGADASHDGPAGEVVVAERSGAVQVRASGSGLPVQVLIDDGLPARTDTERLAGRILRLCTAAAAAAQARRRSELAAAGIDDGLLGRLGLPDADGARAAEDRHTRGEGEPESWLGRV